MQEQKKVIKFCNVCWDETLNVWQGFNCCPRCAGLATKLIMRDRNLTPKRALIYIIETIEREMVRKDEIDSLAKDMIK